MSDLEQRAIDVIRGIAMDGPHQARSGHQGTAMALAPLAHVLFTRVMTYDASEPGWPDRDRFVLSPGHASILQYAMLHLTGFGLELEDLRQFRQWGSRTPGHPEVGHTRGVEVTTGPLGQGFANGVGMGLAERWLRNRFGSEVCDHHVFVVCSDGDLQEGVSHEAASLAGHQGLGRLVYIYDDNHVSIDGPTELALSDDAVARFRAYGWDVVDLGENAENLDLIEEALTEAMHHDDRPSLIVLRSHIAYPSPDVTDDPAAHGYALFDEEIARAKEAMGLPPDQNFHVPADVLSLYREAGVRGGAARAEWTERVAAFSGDRDELEACLTATGLAGWETKLPSWNPGEMVATRKASGACLNAVAEVVPGILAGGADLTGNTGTKLSDARAMSAAAPGGRQIHFGVREHGMAAVMNGMALHGGTLPVGGTFLVFSDYARPAVRLAAMSGAKVIYSFTHDSVGVGEDGPTHQPVEHLMALRAIPGLRVIRPGDANETAAAWRLAVGSDGPTALALTRQDVPVLEGTATGAVERGGYVLVGPDEPMVALVGSGSELAVAVDAAEILVSEGIAARVVSLPCWSLFEAQDAAYRASVLPPEIPTVSVEAGVSLGWDRYADTSVSIDRFGGSAPATRVFEELGITPEAVADAARHLLSSDH